MKYYVEFLRERTDYFDTEKHNWKDCNSYLDKPCGSDSVFILDGRLSLENMVNCALGQMKKLEKVQPNYKGFVIKKGNRFDDNNPVLYTYNPYDLSIYLYD